MPYNIQGQGVRLGAEPFLHGNNKHYVPLRDLVEALGGSVSFDNDAKTATSTIGPWVATVQMGNENVSVAGDNNTTQVGLTAPPFVDESGTMFVPFDFFRDVYGYNVSIAGDTVNISNPNA